MRVLLINPPYQTLTSNIGVGHQVPLGLLMTGGALIDAGHDVSLLDAEALRLSIPAIVRHVEVYRPDVVMTGHAGSTPAHPVTMRMLAAIKALRPQTRTVYGGVFPTYHAREIVAHEHCVDFVVRGEGEATAVDLMNALRDQKPLESVAGVTFRGRHNVVANPDRPPIRDLDQFRVGWELIDDWNRYQCFGLGRAAIVQLSRGCPHQCTYCGQHEFWVRWRHRDPVRVVDEIEMLAKKHRVRFVTLADENPTTLKTVWRRFLEELASRKLPVKLFATIRATDIVRDADILPLYHAAGMLYVLMGIESTEDAVLTRVRKRSTTRHDFLACRLLKRHGIFSILGHIVGLQDESWRTLWHATKHLNTYDGDYLNAMYVTPHDWTPFGRDALQDALGGTLGGQVIDTNLTHWDYRHQVLGQRRLKPWQLFVGVKLMELAFHLRPSRLREIFLTRDPFRRRQFVWTGLHTGGVWVGEITAFVRDQLCTAIDRHRVRKAHGVHTVGVPVKTMSRDYRLPVLSESAATG